MRQIPINRGGGRRRFNEDLASAKFKILSVPSERLGKFLQEWTRCGNFTFAFSLHFRDAVVYLKFQDITVPRNSTDFPVKQWYGAILHNFESASLYTGLPAVHVSLLVKMADVKRRINQSQQVSIPRFPRCLRGGMKSVVKKSDLAQCQLQTFHSKLQFRAISSHFQEVYGRFFKPASVHIYIKSS